MTGLIEGRAFALRPVVPGDYSSLYSWSTVPPTSLTWRFHGSTPNPDMFPALLWDGVLAQFSIVSRTDPTGIVGLIQVFNHDPVNGIAYLGILLGPEDQHRTSAFGEALALMLRHAFTQLNIRKLYAETSAAALRGLARIVTGWESVHEEGCLSNHFFVDGQYEDLIVLAIDRDPYLSTDGPRLEQLLSTAPRALRPNGCTFDEFVAAMPRNLVPELEHVRAISGGCRFVEDLGVDSLGLVELIIWTEETYNLTLPDDVTNNLVTLQDLFGWIDMRNGAL